MYAPTRSKDIGDPVGGKPYSMCLLGMVAVYTRNLQFYLSSLYEQACYYP